MAQQSTEYGRRAGYAWCQFSWPMAASVVLKKAGGSILINDANGRVTTAIATSTQIIGHAMVSENLTSSSTAGGSTIQVDQDLDNVYEMPIDAAGGTWADTMRGTVADLKVTSNVQGVNLTAAAVKQVELIDKGTTNPAGTVVSVLYKINRLILTRATVV